MSPFFQGATSLFPFGYQRIHEVSWAYLASLLMLALFFKFNRFWSFRNVDLTLLILLAPGILMVNCEQIWGNVPPLQDPARSAVPGGSQVGPESATPNAEAAADGLPPPAGDGIPPAAGQPAAPFQQVDSQEPRNFESLGYTERVHRAGYIWLFAVASVLLMRMLLDPLMVRRPLLDPNLSIGGLVFLGCSLLTFIFADIITSRPSAGSLVGARGAMKLVQREVAGESDRRDLIYHGPGYALLHVIPAIPTFTAARTGRDDGAGAAMLEQSLQLEIAAKTLAIVGQIAMVFGLIAIGHYHFSNFRAGVGMAVIWLMMPYTIMYSGNAYHVLPASLIVWAIVLYRQPLASGLMLGLATGVSYYPLFLLPLWLSFYWESRVTRFLVGFLLALAFCVGGLAFTSEGVGHFFLQLQAMFGFWFPRTDQRLLQGIWTLGWEPLFRWPLLVAFVVLCVSFVFWPARKNLGILIAYTSAVMIAVQFWHGYQGGTFVAWYLPLMLATIFRPNLEDRLASTQIPPSRRRTRVDPPQRVTPAA